MTWNDVAIKAVEALIPLVVMVLTVALGYLATWLRQQAAKTKSEVVRAAFEAAIDEAERVAYDAIDATNQVLVDELKRASEDKKLTKEEAADAMRTAIAYFKVHITPGALQMLEAAYGPIEAWLADYLEAKLAQTKGSPYVEIEGIVNPQ
jgi:predicted DNA-binding protein